MGDSEERDRLDPSMGLSVSKLAPGINQDDERFYGVHIPNLSEDDFLHVYDNKVEALKVVKNHKKARFKAFKFRSDAVAFAVRGPENVLSEEGSVAVTGASQGDAEKPSLFKAPKPQDLLQFRRAIENGNLEVVSKTVWDNPRFLISSGDTPSILQEGARYNALHVAAKAKNPVMADFILQTVGNPAFAKLLYGDETVTVKSLGSSGERFVIFLDLYLNTPDKGIHETPLHFASKFGALQVVSILVSYAECDREPKNKFGQRPIDIVCTRLPSASEELKSEITALLQNYYYVPVLRAEDNSVQPTVGNPFSPKEPPILNEDPLSPRLEIHAFAGPMSQYRANEFRRLWRTPQRAKPNNSSDSRTKVAECSSFRLQDPEKGLERIGRDLAADCNVPWKEYWPFLNTFTDLSSSEGLNLLEEFLSKRYQSVEGVGPSTKLDDDSSEPCAQDMSCQAIKVNYSLDGTNTEPEILSPVSQLCTLMTACTILDDSVGSGIGRGSPMSPSFSASPSSSPSNGSIMSSSARFFDWLSRRHHENDKSVAEKSQNEAILTALSNPSVSPFLYVEKSLQLFAKRIADSLHHLVSGSTTHHLSDSIKDVLKPEVKRVQSLVGSYMEDARFVAVDYHLVHSRIACSVAERLVGQLTWEERETFYNGLQELLNVKGHLDGTISSDDDEIISSSTSYRQSRSSRQPSSSSHKTAIRCIVGQMVWALDQLEGSGPDGRSPLPPRPQVRTESECLEMWSDAYLCLCSWPSNSQSNFSRGSRKSSSMKRSMNSSHNIENPNISRRLDYDSKDESKDEGHKTQKIGGTALVELADEENEIFYTPPTSPIESPVPSDSDSEEELYDPDEGPLVFLEGSEPSRLDADVVNAIISCNISPSSHPYVYRWRHEVLLHPAEERKRWPTRKTEHSSSSQVATFTSTPVCGKTPVSSNKSAAWFAAPSWSRITGPYSPSPSKGCEKA